MYFLDSHKYSPDDRRWPGYDWIKESQIQWFLDQRSSLAIDTQRYTHIHLQMAFVHIPLPEYRNNTNAKIGNWLEPPTAPSYNSKFRDVLAKNGVSIVAAGHDHANDYCLFDSGKAEDTHMWMCYGGGAGFGGYGGYGGYIRRVRMFEVETGPDRVTTWKRLEWGDTKSAIDKQVLVEAGKVSALV